MSVVIPSLRGAIAVPGWAKNELWRKARAVPSLDLRFADSKSLTDAFTGSSLVTFTRASSGTFVGSNGVLQTATNDVARFDHNPTTGESLGLLVEEARTNVAWPSANYSGANWTKTNIQVSASTTTAPDGSTCFAYEGSSASSLLKRLRFNFTTTTVGAYTFSIYLKAGTENSCAITLQDNTGLNGGVVEILLTNGTVAVAASNFGVNTGTAVLVQALSNGFYRISLTSTFVAAVTGLQAITGWDTNGSTTTTGTIFPWGAQLEAGAFPTSYIPTTAAAATRSADVASITGSAFSGWYRQDEGTVFAEGRAVNNGVIAVANDGSFNNRKPQLNLGAIGSVDANYVAAGSIVAPFTQVSSVGISNRWATAYAVDNFGFSSNGLAPAQDSSGALPSGINALRLGSFQNGSSYANGPIKRLCFWPTRLANSTLQTLTQ